MTQKTRHLYEFGPFSLDPDECLLLLDGKPVPLTPKAFEALLTLVENAGHLVDKDDLMRRLWPDSFVEEGNVAKHVSLLRKVLGEATNGREFIETIPKRGYRFVADVREVSDPSTGSEAQALPTENPTGKKWHTLAFGALALVLFVPIAVLWFGRTRTPSRQSLPELQLRELTSNSYENRVLSGAISPDGKYLAYSDAKGMRVQVVATGETRVIPQPEELKGKQIDWEVVGTWFPEGTRFVANAHSPGGSGIYSEDRWNSTSSMWMVSILGGAPRKLRDNAVAYSVSPDGSLVGFGTNAGRLGNREMWLMGPNGEQTRKLFETDEESSIAGLSWSSDGKRVLYKRSDQSGDTLFSRDLEGGPPMAVLGPREMKQVNDFFWLPDGRLLYLVPEPESLEGNLCNFWEMPLDKRSGRPVAKPRRLTTWSGSCMSGMSITADGAKLTFLKSADKETAFLAELAASWDAHSRTQAFSFNRELRRCSRLDIPTARQSSSYPIDSVIAEFTDKLSTRTSPNQS